MGKGFNLKAIFSADTKDIEAGSTRATESVKKFDRDSKAALDAFAGRTEVAGKKAQVLGKNIKALALRFAAAAVSIKSFVSSFNTMKDFETANSKLAAVLGTTQKGIEKLTESAITLGRKTEYTASQVTELQTELAKLGFSQGDIMSMQAGVLKFAAAVGTDLGSAAARAGATMRGFGLTAKETGDMLAVMALSTSKSALSFEYLDETLGKVVPVTRAFGLDTRATVALLGAMANAGIDASSAGTALRRIMAELSNSGSKLNSMLGRQPKTMEDVIAGLKQLRDQGIGVTEAFDLVGKYAGATFLALVNGASDCETLYGELKNVDGSLNDMYRTMTDNVEGSIKKLSSAWEGFILRLRNSTGPINRMIKGLTKLVELADRLNPETRIGGEKDYYDMVIRQKVEYEGADAFDIGVYYAKEKEKLQGLISESWNNGRGNRAKKYEEELGGLERAYSDFFENRIDFTEPLAPDGTNKPKGGKDDDKKSKKSDGLKKLQDEAREYAAAEQEVIEADKEMEAEAARLYESYKSLHPAIEGVKVDVDKLTGLTDEQKATLLSVIQPIDNTAQGVVALANQIATLVDLDQNASSATNQFAEQLYGLGDAFQAVVYAAGLTDEQLTDEVNKLSDQWADGLLRMQETSKEFSDAIREILLDAMEDTLNNVGTFIGDALTLGFDTAASNLGTNMLDTLGTLVQRVGELCLAVGEGILAIDESLNSLNPYVALAAGAALVMLGAAVKSAASNLASGMGTYSSSRSLSDSYSPYSTGELETRALNIKVTGRLLGDGRNLIGVIQEAEKYTNHTT